MAIHRRRHARYAARAGREAAALTMSAAFSAIMMIGALVLPETSVGMIDASTTRKPANLFVHIGCSQ